MTKMVSFKNVKTSYREKEVIESYVSKSNKDNMFDLSQKQVEMFFDHWGEGLSDLPLSHRMDIMKLGRPKEFSLHDKVV